LRTGTRRLRTTPGANGLSADGRKFVAEVDDAYDVVISSGDMPRQRPRPALYSGRSTSVAPASAARWPGRVQGLEFSFSDYSPSAQCHARGRSVFPKSKATGCTSLVPLLLGFLVRHRTGCRTNGRRPRCDGRRGPAGTQWLGHLDGRRLRACAGHCKETAVSAFACWPDLGRTAWPFFAPPPHAAARGDASRTLSPRSCSTHCPLVS